MIDMQLMVKYQVLTDPKSKNRKSLNIQSEDGFDPVKYKSKIKMISKTVRIIGVMSAMYLLANAIAISIIK